LHRQVRLLEHLTSSGAIFGEEGNVPLDQALRGIDSRLLCLEARFSHEKRMEKIVAVFSKTFGLLGANRVPIVREFVAAYPPTDITRLENARQFYDFVCRRWRREPIDPPYLNDVAACEFACASVRGGGKPPQSEPGHGKRPGGGNVRRHPDVVLLRCAYDIRPIFEGGPEQGAPMRRDTPLAVAIPPGAEHPGVSELPPPVFDALGALDDWTGRSALGTGPEVDELIGELEQHGLVEVRR
jgi:hypothetical protein